MFVWKSYDKTTTYTYSKTSHTVVVTGYDEEHYFINDPLKGKDIAVEKKKAEKSFDALGRQYIKIQLYDTSEFEEKAYDEE